MNIIFDRWFQEVIASEEWSGPLFEIPVVSLSKGLALECRHLEGADEPTQRLARCSKNLERASNSSKSRCGDGFVDVEA